jgi:hypothetical protein
MITEKTQTKDLNKNLFINKVTHKLFTHNLEPLTESCQGMYHIPLDSFSVSLLQLIE